MNGQSKLKNLNFIFKYRFLIMLFLVLVFAIVGIIFIPKAFAQPVRNIDIISDSASFDDKEPGAWKVDKSAKWTSKGEAEITFDVASILKSRSRYTDVLFVLDVSESMAGSKLDKVKSDTTEFVNSLLSKDGNRMGIITFDTDSEIVTELTSDKELLLEKINGLTEKGRTNYYQALVNVDKALKNYVEEENRECIVLFLTDGYPNEDTPNEVSQYSYLKKAYPFITINGVQYEMGNTILSPIKQVSDNQFSANQSTLNSVLFDAIITPKIYDKFEISDYINTDYFLVENEKNIEAEQGIIEFDKTNQKITWKMDNLRTGSKSKMTIKIKLKEEFIGQGGVYSTNKSEEIHSKLGEVLDDIVSDKTPILLDNYKVTYDGNAPDGSNVTGVPEEEIKAIFDVVGISETIPVCEGYQFKGWEITTKDVKRVNDDYFVMPEDDVVLKAKWSKLSITKSMTGEITEKHTLYKQVENDANSNNHARVYTGDTSTFNGKEKVYYYYGETPNNNVIFGGFCWRMVRTTDTGGVKTIYNGEPDSEGKCGTNRGNHVGYGARTSTSLSASYLYGTDYTYDEATKTFTLAGTTEIARWNASTYPNLIGNYTCLNATGSCSKLYYVSEYNSDTSAYTLPINSTTMYSLIGISAFNANDSSPADVGYMYNKRYTYNSKSMTSSTSILSSSSLSTGYYYADDIDWNVTTANRYTLLEPYRVEATTDYPSLVGKYTFRSSTETNTSSSVYYIVGVSGSTMYYIQLSSGQELTGADTEYTFADSIIDDGAGKNILDPTTTKTVKKTEWYTNYPDYKGKYFQDASGNICYVTATSNKDFTYMNIENDYMYGNTFTYNEETEEYTLSGETQHFYDWPNNYSKLGNAHYTCWNTSGTCKTISYIYYADNSTTYYINLEKNTSVEKALEEMLYDENVNTTNSTIKNVIDAWYSKNMTEYTDYLEDTVWCNSRKISALNGWNPNGGSLDKYLYYWSNENISNLTCPDKIDSFTVDAKNGNGALTYPVGLVTRTEQNLAYYGSNSSLRYDGSHWTLSPYSFYYDSAIVSNLGGFGDWYYHSVDIAYYVHPAVSLRAGIEYESGDGTVDHPYVIDMNS